MGNFWLFGVRKLLVVLVAEYKKCKPELKRLRTKVDSYSRDRYKEVKKDMFIILEQREVF